MGSDCQVAARSHWQRHQESLELYHQAQVEDEEQQLWRILRWEHRPEVEFQHSGEAEAWRVEDQLHYGGVHEETAWEQSEGRALQKYHFGDAVYRLAGTASLQRHHEQYQGYPRLMISMQQPYTITPLFYGWGWGWPSRWRSASTNRGNFQDMCKFEARYKSSIHGQAQSPLFYFCNKCQQTLISY